MTSTPVPIVPPPPPPSGPITSLSTSLPPSSCCENGRPIITDPHTGQSVCSCQYGSGLLSAYNRVPSIGDNMYTSPHYATQGYMPLNTDTSAFYSPLVSTLFIMYIRDHFVSFVCMQKSKNKNTERMTGIRFGMI